MSGIHQTSSEMVQEAGRKLSRGMVIAFPTETFYGLGVAPASYEGVSELLRLKGRLPGIGVPLIIHDAAFVDEWVADESTVLATQRKALQTHFWPGPLSIVFRPRSELIPTIHPTLLGPDSTLAVRISPYLIASALAAAAGGIITATSANPHGEPPPTTGAEVRKYFPEMFIVPPDPDFPPQGHQPSTMVDVTTFPFKIIREGAIPAERLGAWTGGEKKS